jgi:hypothetical protein
MAFSSWLRHEEMRAEEFKKYKEDEHQAPLWIKAEVLDDPKYKYHSLKYFDKIIINLE